MLLLVLIGIVVFGGAGAVAPMAVPAPPAAEAPVAPALAPPAEAAPAVAAPPAPAPSPSPSREPEAQVPSGRFTTAVEIRPILDATRPSWVAVREFDGQDLLYFTQLMSWRCGLWEVRYGLNGAPADIPVPMEPCHEDTAQPNALVDIEGFRPYVAAPLGSIESVDVTVVYDDGREDGAVYARSSILMPG